MLNKKMKDINFKNYIPTILNDVNPSNQISASTKDVVNSLLNKIGNKISNEAVFLTTHCGGKTVTRRAMTASVRLTLTNEIGKHAISEALKACQKYENSDTGSKSNPTTAAKRARLVLPPSRARNLIEHNSPKGIKISQLAGVYLAGVLEYLTAEIMELAGNVAHDNRKSTITSRHLHLAVRLDDELNTIFGNTGIAGSGVIPNIHHVLLQKPKKKKKKKKK
jgi:histone H2A